MISVIFMGTPDFAVPALQALISDPTIEVQAVLCSPDKPVGRKQLLQAPPVKICAEAHNIPVHQPTTLRDNEEIVEILRTHAPDFFVVAAYGFIIPKKILEIPRIMPINIHGSLLPKYRGASPIQSALLHGEKVTGLTFIEMVAKMDAGDMLRHVPLPISPTETADSLFEKLSTLAGVHISPLLHEIASGTYTRTVQDPAEVTFCHKLTKDMGLIDVHREDAQEIYQKWQAFTSWPGIYTHWQEKRVKFLACSPSLESLPTGQVLLKENALLIGCRTGSLLVHTLQLEGKKPMDATTFFRGYPTFSL